MSTIAWFYLQGFHLCNEESSNRDNIKKTSILIEVLKV
jgi:hypothetical protein